MSRTMSQQMNHQPNLVIACVGGGSNAIGIFSAFLQDEQVRTDRCGSWRPRNATWESTRRDFIRQLAVFCMVVIPSYCKINMDKSHLRLRFPLDLDYPAVARNMPNSFKISVLNMLQSPMMKRCKRLNY